MGMKLLTKSDVDKAKANQQKKDIDEGLKLARRIDNLREISAQEEQSLVKFRQDSVSKINKEISDLTTIKERLIEDIVVSKSKQDTERRSLDDEWNKLSIEKDKLTKFESELVSREKEILIKEKNINDSQKETSELLIKASLKDERATELLINTDNKDKQSGITLKNANDIEKKSIELKSKFDREMIDKSIELSVKERELQMRENNILKEEEKLSKEWALLKDRKMMVEKRIKK